MNMMEEDDNSFEEEEVIVLAKFSNANHKALIQESKSIKFSTSSLFTENPVCIIDGLKFTGNHEVEVGTQLYLNKNSSSKDDLIIGMSEKIIQFNLSSIIPSSFDIDNVNENNESQNDKTVDETNKSMHTELVDDNSK